MVSWVNEWGMNAELYSVVLLPIRASEMQRNLIRVQDQCT